MSITEEIYESQGLRKKIKDAVQLPDLKNQLQYFLLIIGYWGTTFILHDLYNDYRLDKYKKHLFERLSNPHSIHTSSQRAFKYTNIIIIIAVSLAILLIIINNSIRRSYLIVLADAAFFICTVGATIKHAAIKIRKSFCAINRQSK